MDIIWAIIIGLLAGIVAKALMPGKDPGGLIITVLIGIIGSVIFTFLGRALGFYGEGESAGFIGAVIGAILLLWIYRLFVKRRRIV
ncbi:MAG: GlsB/YeaQ/YmgE family stress response membrane protein [Ignavibacteria bacterium]